MENNFNIATRLHAHALQQPDKLALVQPGLQQDNVLTYAQLSRLTQGYAQFFTRHGIGADDRVLMLVPLSPDFYALYLALMQTGATVMLVDPGAGSVHVRKCLHMQKPTALIGAPKAQLLRLYPELRSGVKAFCTGWFPFAHRLKGGYTHSDKSPVYEAQEDHPALITFTSGSTGRPKGIVRTHGFLLRQADALARLMHAPQDAVEFCSFPVFVLSNLSQGITTVLPPEGTSSLRTTDFSLVLKSMAKYHVTRLLAAPDFCYRLTLEPEAEKVLQSIGHIHTGGGPVHINILSRLQSMAPQAKIMALYGSTEAEPIALQNLSSLKKQDYTRIAQGAGLPAGMPVNIVHLRIIKDQTGVPIMPMTAKGLDDISLAQGEVGEIVVTGSLVQKGYMNKDDNRETKFEVDGTIWHRTGDAGYLDEEGKLWLQGRCSAKTWIQEKWVYPFAVEAAASIHADVQRAAFVQIERRNILVIEGESISEQARSELKSHFPYLDEIVTLPHIPVDKRHHSKILYPELKKLLGQE